MWEDARDPRGTIVEAYLRSRCLNLPDNIASEVLRFHPACPWEAGAAPAMVAPLRCIRTGDVIGVHRTALTPDGTKLGRKMFGTATGAAIMLDSEDAITSGLAIGEGIESCLAARQLGILPVWALGSASAMAAFPLLPGIQSLTLLEERDGGASNRACTEVGTRWHRAGRVVDVVLPRVGKDINDQIREGATAWH
ncbi:toprim domain-containing protein [Methylobacterium sp. A54F]